MHSSVIMRAILRLSAGLNAPGTFIASPGYAAPRPMSLFLFKRILTLIATLIGASVIVFLVLEILPGNAAQLLMGPDAAPEAVAALATKLGLDQPAWTRYWHWIGGI